MLIDMLCKDLACWAKISADRTLKYFSYYSPALKKWGYAGFAMSFRDSVTP